PYYTPSLHDALPIFRAEALAGADQALLRQVDRFGAVGDGIADDSRLPPVALQDREGGFGVGLADDHAEADPHIVDLVHLGSRDTGMLLDQIEDRRRGWRIVDDEPDFGRHPRQVQ